MIELVPKLIQRMDNWQKTRILVVGDFMLDRYSYGNADRLSPDAPVPVLAIKRQEDKPGGAGNVCLGLAALGCEVECFGIIGEDAPGQDLEKVLKDVGCKTTGLVRSKHRPTTVKQSLVGLAQHRHPQKMFRLDVEDAQPMDDKTAGQLVKAVERAMTGKTKPDVLCLEDYNKGVLSAAVCQSLIALANKAGIPVLVDPAPIEDYSKYAGATTLTPNRTEAARATGRSLNGNLDEVEAAGRDMLKKHKLQTLVLTLDRHGAMLLEKRKPTQMVPTQARNVYDVTGAGDTVLAMLAAARANGLNWHEAVALANVAAGLEVERFGVVPIRTDEVLLYLLELHHADTGKVRTLDHLLRELHAHRAQGKRIAFTNGCFDILHAGHVAFLRESRKQGDLLIVGLNSDDSIQRLKGKDRPVNHLEDRLTVLSELQSVDYIVVFDEDTPIELIKAIQPDALIKGADYKKHEVVGHDVVEKHGGKVVLVDLVAGRSTTNIIQRMTSNRKGAK